MYIWSIQYAEMPAGLYGLRGVWMKHGWKDRMIDRSSYLISDYKHTLLCFSVIHWRIRGHIRGHRNWKKAPLFFVYYDTVNISKGHRLVSVFLHLSRLFDAIMNNHSKQQMLVQYWRNAGYTWKIFFLEGDSVSSSFTKASNDKRFKWTYAHLHMTMYPPI